MYLTTFCGCCCLSAATLAGKAPKVFAQALTVVVPSSNVMTQYYVFPLPSSTTPSVQRNCRVSPSIATPSQYH